MAGERRFTSFEMCAGMGGQALGLERAGFDPVLVLDKSPDACSTLALNRPWNVQCWDVREFDSHSLPSTLRKQVIGVDLISAGLPRVKSAAQVARRGSDDEERHVLRTVARLSTAIRPAAVLLENLDVLVTGDKFEADRTWVDTCLSDAGYRTFWRVLDAVDFEVPQYRRSGFLVALDHDVADRFEWPTPLGTPAATVGDVLRESMASRGWHGAKSWSVDRACRPGPALVGGSDRRGGADLGLTGSKKAWRQMGVDGSSLANEVPDASFPVDGTPKITVRQAALLQRIPEEWHISGKKTAVYRQIGHAMPPPLAEAVGKSIARALAG